MDSIEALAEAVDAVVSANGERTVVFTSGPEELELVLVREADRVDIRLFSYRDRRRDSPGEERLAFVLNPQLTGKLFWRALRQLRGASCILGRQGICAGSGAVKRARQTQAKFFRNFRR